MNPSLFVCGPTACGKSELAVTLAKALGGEVISIDSVQIYKGFDIGSAKIPPKEMNGVPHHLLSTYEPDQPVNVAEYRELAIKTAKRIANRGALPIFAGGTTMYISALVHGLAELPPADPSLRAELDSLSSDELMKRLELLDSSVAKKLHVNDRLRVIRAIESCERGGESVTEARNRHLSEQVLIPGLMLVICSSRKELYGRINQRSKQMLELGLLEEVEKIVNLYGENLAALATLGYAQAMKYRRGELSDKELVSEIAQGTRRYAKRQMTFWRNEPLKRGWEVHPAQQTEPESVEIVRVGDEPTGPSKRPQKGFLAWSLEMGELLEMVKKRFERPLKGVEVWYINIKTT